ncbi:MAG: beta-ketoacyl-[acyl-carrier-protein] synthase II [Candidatus Marinimicrobia bacterium CG08_land_8_20_14_0_20_45_22]|nr:MAG: beta-ketoacyl-[acyl-carrier-protein] synthase II [Candidatus Marinimicrobia bacterium CG08_land_8_20_14_0_20_45_22]
MKRRVVVTGLGIITPIGCSLPDYWESLENGTSGVKLIESFDAHELPVRIAAEARAFDPVTYLPLKDIKRMDRMAQLGVSAAKQAVDDSQLLTSTFRQERVGVVTGSGIGGIETLEFQHSQLITKGARFVSPLFIPMMIPNIFPGQIAIDFGFSGPNYSVASACATSSHAIGIAMMHILCNDADVMITGGSEASITPLAIAGFSNMKALSRRNDEPARASRPFDLNRDGFIVGEGAGIIVLEELGHALKRDAHIYAELVGYGFSEDAFHITQPHPGGKGSAMAIENAIRMSGLPKEAFGYINAHGTSTILNDKLETIAIKSVFGDDAKKIAISSTKSMTGHLLGAAGAIEFIALVLAMNHQIIPPTINYETPDPECDLNYTPNIAQKRDFSAGLSNNFGFGGHNSVLAIKKFEK